MDITFYLIFHTTVTLNEGQGYQNRQSNVELNGPYHHAKFVRNRPVNVWMPAYLKVVVAGFFLRNQNHGSSVLSFNCVHHGWEKISKIHHTNKPQQYSKFHSNRLKTLWDNWCRSFAFLHSCDLESRSKSFRLISKCRIQQYLSSLNHVWTKLVHKHQNACQCLISFK